MCFIADQHTGADITAAVEDRCTYWFGSTATVIAATSDNGQNMVNGLQDAGFLHIIGCAAHTVHLRVDKGLKAAQVLVYWQKPGRSWSTSARAASQHTSSIRFSLTA